MNSFENDRRFRKDRRKRAGFNVRALIYGRRGNIRRKEDNHRIFYVDRYNSSLFGLIVVILFLSVLDALLTLFLIDNGAFEVNPIMAYYLNIGPYTFFSVKYLLTSIAVIILLMFRNIFLRTIKIHTRSLFYFIIAAFMTVVGWQFYLIFGVVNRIQ